MYKLSSIVFLLLISIYLKGQNPHGDQLSVDCASCHNPNTWLISIDTFHFNHDTTAFPLSGSHLNVDCKSCHSDLSFQIKEQECINCHPDIHQATVGTDCIRCHTTNDWLVFEIPEIHEANGFPLTGAHQNISCIECHLNENPVRFDPIGNDCISCHLEDFNSAENPVHTKEHFSTNCIECHNPDFGGWGSENFNHSFFPLTEGHAITDCRICHLSDDYSDISSDCISCHGSDFDSAINPDHKTAGFDTDCVQCHTTAPDWSPAEFATHDNLYFPIYSGKHEGTWTDCIDCHLDQDNFSSFSCVTCHTDPEATDIHKEVDGFVFEDNACLACHPSGSEDNIFDHNATRFPLTGVHLTTDCIECHMNGFEGTPFECASCHQNDFENTINPKHSSLGISNDCVSCHTTDPDWRPATFANHDDFYVLNGAHAIISNDCVLCHNGNYNETPNTCVGCHLEDYQNTNSPDHSLSGFGTDCIQCHNESEWETAEFDHDAQFFPIYSGVHQGEWSECIDCHINPANFSEFQCINCHLNPETDDAHLTVNGYIYEDNACLACHPNGDADMTFDHNTTAFPLTGSHLDVDCLQCHINGFEGTPTDCASCHTNDFNNSLNPNHSQLGISNDCVSCHTTDPDWQPATFEIHDDFYALNGAHALIANNCVECHQGDYINTPNTCIGCHQEDYNLTSNPNHMASGFGTDCLECHTESNWTPATFDHDNQYFPIYSGSHMGEWNACIDCHINPTNFAEFQCINCHTNPETDDEHIGIGGYIYENNACLACHPTGEADMVFDHNSTMFPLTGAHTNTDCLQCHSNGFEGTPTDCASCHQNDFNNSNNPNHISLGLTNECINCHTTTPGWEPASFDVHNDYYQLNGAHALISNDCVTCHAGEYNNTNNTCFGCHAEEYNTTTNPNHMASGFGTECLDCHNETSWMPAIFDHDNQYFPIYSGTHLNEWNECVDCHSDPSNFSLFQCINCHLNPETDNEHVGVGGYIYENNACLMCHPNGEAMEGINHDLTNFPLTGAHIGVACIECHLNGYEGTPTDCNACHQEDFNQSSNPNHTVLGISTDCVSCHTTDPGWSPATFDIHDNYYALTGAHLTISNDCVLCHNGDYNNTPNTCVGCHQMDYNESINPDHQTLNIPTDCMNCHTTDPGWSPATFDIHDNYYTLTGAHEPIANDCVLCHNGDYNNTPNTCVGCHQEDYNDSSNPDHQSLNIPTDCMNCHTTDPGWIPATFDIHDNYYPLTGAHEPIANDCVLCHNGDYNNTPNTCVGCHQENYNDTSNPDHISLNIPNDCMNCHITDPGWMPATFDIHDDYYELNGAHALIANDCVLCHNGDYNNTPNTCVGCHEGDYNNTTNPDHIEADFSNDCLECHNEDAWIPSTFSHDFFQLNGAHTTLDCNSCHADGYQNTPTTCFGCHESDYNNTTNPDHATAMFPTDCLNCHNEDAWTPSSFEHDNLYFPIFSGRHEGEWNLCADCHINSSNFSVFSCIDCHEHNNQADVDDDHDGVGGYIYESNACYSCHPNGEE